MFFCNPMYYLILDMASRDKRDRLTFDVGGLRDRLRKQAIEPGQSLASIVRMALAEWLDWKEGMLQNRPSPELLAINMASADSIQALIAYSDIKVLSMETKITEQRLIQLKNGEYPTDVELTLLEKGLRVPLEYLLKLRNKKFLRKKDHAMMEN